MPATLFVTHTGVAILAIPFPGFRHRQGYLRAGSAWMTLEPEQGTITLGLPSALGSDTTTIPGMPPEMVAHLGYLPGLLCVAVNDLGMPAMEWIACNPGHAPEPVTAAIDTTASGAPAPLLSSALMDGLFAACSSHSWPEAPSSSPSDGDFPAGAFAADAILATRRSAIRPPAGAFWGHFAEPIQTGRQEAFDLSTRLASAIAALRTVVLNGLPIGERLAAVIETPGLRIAWSNPSPVTHAQLTQDIPVPPPCGYDASTNTIYLSPDLPPSLDPSYLAPALYFAHTARIGALPTCRLASMVVSNGQDTYPKTAFIEDSLRDAAHGWLLQAGIARALGQEVAPLIAALLPPPHLAGDEHDTALATALSAAMNILRPIFQDELASLHSDAQAMRASWFDPAKRSTLPIPMAHAN